MNLNTTCLLLRSWYVSQSPRSSKVAVFPIIFLIAAGWGCRYVLLKDYVKSAKVGGFETWINSSQTGCLELWVVTNWNSFMDIWLRSFLSKSHECNDWRVGELPMFFAVLRDFFSSEHGWIEVFSSRRMALVSWIAWLAVYFGGMGCWYIRSYLVMASDDVI